MCQSFTPYSKVANGYPHEIWQFDKFTRIDCVLVFHFARPNRSHVTQTHLNIALYKFIAHFDVQIGLRYKSYAPASTQYQICVLLKMKRNLLKICKFCWTDGRMANGINTMEPIVFN